jgi:PhnB protein
MPIQPYLFFNGRCEEAIEFYKKALDAKVTALMRFSEAPGTPPPDSENKVMHSELRIGDAVLLASDGMAELWGKPTTFKGIELALTAANPKEASRLFAALSDGGTVQMPLAETFFSPGFGSLTDRFGVQWMVVV